MHNPEVTVVTPTIGRLDRLRAALRSVAAQRVAVEHVVVGDDCAARGCRDEVAEIVASFDHARFLDVTAADLPEGLQPYLPARLAFLRNTGVAAGSGEFVCHLDDDNAFEVDHLSSLVELLRANPDVPVAHSWRLLVDDNDVPFVPDGVDPWYPEPDGRRDSYRRLAELGVFEPGSAVVRDRLWAGDEVLGRIDTGEFLIRRTYAEKHGFPQRFTPRQQELEITEDMAYALSMARRGVRPLCTEKATLRYTMGGYSNADSLDSATPRVDLRKQTATGGSIR
ncbi:glycosyltransferase family A protein [Saccharomonospora glauca]|jgi:glycosyltransferase involved in cell wall biosynthesis|uniref:Glycosyl transferase n=1 Tax=Saccharomonospora glauca K62 TaxID=928724 RepID=I1CYP5_9PSEU|nr:glycosyltransferase family A protein [Saccharomonospora glauca]EIE97819.1 glycosyl transferase [Saccharomonospora glauca K62]